MIERVVIKGARLGLVFVCEVGVDGVPLRLALQRDGAILEVVVL